MLQKLQAFQERTCKLSRRENIEGLTRIRCEALTIHQERRYLSALQYKGIQKYYTTLYSIYYLYI